MPGPLSPYDWSDAKEMLLKHPEWSNRYIASKLPIHLETVRRIRHSESFQDYLNKQRAVMAKYRKKSQK